MNGKKEGRTKGKRTDGRMEERKDGRTRKEGRETGRKEGRKEGKWEEGRWVLTMPESFASPLAEGILGGHPNRERKEGRGRRKGEGLMKEGEKEEGKGRITE
jgi:hypothetical protein